MSCTPRALARIVPLLFAAAAPVASSHAQGVGYCFGDPGSGAPCPCNNDNDGSVPGSGCASGVFPQGAHLTGMGLAEVTHDTLVLMTTRVEPNNTCLYFQGNHALHGGDGMAFGDGLRCAGGGLIRIEVRTSNGIGTSITTIPIGAKGNAAPGDTRYYQCWYRTLIDSPCGSGVNDFNTSNGYAVTWVLGDEMVLVPAGTFEMGDHHDGVGWALPVHTVYLDAFYMDVYEVSTSEYASYLNAAYAEGRVTVSGTTVYQVGGAGQALCETNGFYSRITWNGATFGVIPGKEEHPMAEVSWYGACTFANQRSRDDGLTLCYDETNWTCDWTADGYRLPTEAEWEYAARGGEHNPYFRHSWGDAFDGSNANYVDSGDPYEAGNRPWTTPVGYYDGNQTPAGLDMANGYGLYDMPGSVWEWCWDRYDPNYYSSSPPSNPTGPTSGGLRVRRGGGWNHAPSNLRSAHRYYAYPTSLFYDTGFRVLAVLP